MRRIRILCFTALVLTLFSRTAAYAQITPLADSYTASAEATTTLPSAPAAPVTITIFPSIGGSPSKVGQSSPH